jgi:hypothetical protein
MGENAVDLQQLLESDGLPPADLLMTMLRIEETPTRKPLVAV